MIPRYSTVEMEQIWSDETRFKTMFDVELAALSALENSGVVAGNYSAVLQKSAKSVDWTKLAGRAADIEKTTKHDVIAFLTAIEELFGEQTRFLHFGMTSSDLVDTAFALHLKTAGEQLAGRLARLTQVLWQQAQKHQKTVCLGRTHGQAAEVTTFGLKLLSFVMEMHRHCQRIDAAIKEISFGKFSGAVGNYGKFSPAVEKEALKMLGLEPEPLATQVVPRDRHAVFFATLAILAGGLERLSVEIRHLMRTEVAEAFEPFGKGQKGSSAMPHKRNPILSENVTGLARLIRGYVVPAMENQALWHERDISHSSVERVIAPDATTLTDFALHRMTQLIEGLEVDAEKMRQHVENAGGLIFSEAILLGLVAKGLLRQEAYALVQSAAQVALAKKISFAEAIGQERDILKHLSQKEVDQAFDIQYHLRHVDEIFDRAKGILATT